MKYIYIYIIILLSPFFTFAKIIPHTFDVYTIIDTRFFGDTLAITGKDGLIPIDNGELFINKDGTFISSDLILEAHKIENGIIDINKYSGNTLWSLIKSETFVESIIKDIKLHINIDGENFEVGHKYLVQDSSITLNIDNVEKIEGLNPGQTITSVLTILLEPDI
ncbi:TPA: hypothetical protein ACX6Q0_003773 [Photobacterium damselae]